MTELHGVTGAPYNTPQIRRAMPAPFNRPRIDLDGGRRIKRSWKDTQVGKVKKGDTVADVGLIEAVIETIELPGLGTEEPLIDMPWRVQLHNVQGDFWNFSGHQRVYAFTPDDETETA